jgi:hypothetical protein
VRAPATEYWADVIGAIRALTPTSCSSPRPTGTWSGTLQQLGFDHCYDKRLYDRLLHEGPGSVRGHLQADLGYQRGLIRFIENHDEPRAAAVMSRPQSIAAAVMIATTARGDAVARGPVRRLEGPPPGVPRPPPGGAIGHRPARGLPGVDRRGADDPRRGVVGLRGHRLARDSCCEQLVTWCWRSGRCAQPRGGQPVRRHRPRPVHVPWDDLGGRDWRMDDVLTGAVFERSGDELASEGLYVGLAPWGCHVLRWR